jgi:hypothetical protein
VRGLLRGRCRLLGGTGGVVPIAQLAQRIDATRVEGRKLHSELSAAGALAAPGDYPLDHDLATVVLETAHQRSAFVGEVGGAQVHAALAHIHRFGLESGYSWLIAHDFDQRFHCHTALAFSAAFLCLRHAASGLGSVVGRRGLTLEYAANAPLAKFWQLR